MRSTGTESDSVFAHAAPHFGPERFHAACAHQRSRAVPPRRSPSRKSPAPRTDRPLDAGRSLTLTSGAESKSLLSPTGHACVGVRRSRPQTGTPDFSLAFSHQTPETSIRDCAYAVPEPPLFPCALCTPRRPRQFRRNHPHRILHTQSTTTHLCMHRAIAPAPRSSAQLLISSAFRRVTQQSMYQRRRHSFETSHVHTAIEPQIRSVEHIRRKCPMTFKTTTAILSCIIFIGSSVNSASALSLGKVLRDFKKGVVSVVETGAKLHPINVGVKVIKGKSADDIVEEYVNDIEEHGRALSEIPTFAAPGFRVARQAYVDAIRQVYGDDVAEVFQGIVNRQRTMEHLPSSNYEAAVLAIRKGDAGFLVTAALASPISSALKQANEYFRDRAKPLPPNVRLGLSKHFDASVLNRARFVVNRDPTTLNGQITWLQTKVFDEDNFGVVADEIIIFAKRPLDTNLSFWAHEVTHTVQFRRLGIDQFAHEYVVDLMTKRDMIRG